MRLYVLQLGLLPAFDNIALPGYLIQTDDGTNVLIDTAIPAVSAAGRSRPPPTCLRPTPMTR